jgi:V/A-type H+/Na+-transporting ATPase subunit I
MFYPEGMTEVEFIITAKDLMAVTHALAGQGTFQQADASYLSVEAGVGSADVWQQKVTAYGALERRILTNMQLLNVDEGRPAPADGAAMADLETITPQVEQIEQKVQNSSRQLAAEQKRIEQLESFLRQMEPVAGIDVNVTALRNPRHLFSVLGSIPTANIARLEASLARTPYVLLNLRQDNREAVVLLAGAKQHADNLERAARSAYLNPLNLPEAYSGTPSEIIRALHADMDKVRQQITEEHGTLVKLHDTHGRQLQNLLWSVRSSRMLADAIAHFGRLRYTYLIVGWVPTSRVADLRQRLKQVSSEILIETRPTKRSEAKQDVPVSLRNPGIVGAFQLLTTTYARPNYREVDPTVLMMITFPILFGAMFGDFGQGIVLALLGLLLVSRRVKSLRSMSSLGVIVVACGLVASVFGLLYGSVFGMEDIIQALWMRPLDNILTILGVAIGGGVFLLTLGFVLNIINAIIARDVGRLVFSHNGIAGIVLYWSLLGILASSAISGFPIPTTVFVILAIVAGVAVMFAEIFIHLVEGHRPLVEGGIGTYGFQAAVELFETLISFMSNSLSYVRVGAFAVAHAGLSQVIFILAAMVSANHGVGYWIVVVIGNLFIIGFEGLIVSIQTMRLEYYEFFSKFFTGGGTGYKPLTVQPSINE